jgi:hypothetical protein
LQAELIARLNWPIRAAMLDDQIANIRGI